MTPTTEPTPVVVTIAEKELSGAQWVTKYPGSSDTADLEEDFKIATESFLAALRLAKATVYIAATFRPPERAYLMHWSWKIAHKKVKPEKVPARSGILIEWDHGDEEKSIQAAKSMVSSYGMDGLKVAPALSSRHTEGKAIDMSIAWSSKVLTISDASGKEIEIKEGVKNGMNSELHKIGESYGVIKFKLGAKDKPHWSSDGK
ncbi:fructose/tagatose bisphosphate aldolase [Silvimonas terrae]|uniref:Fructose/tagatose bisphosphate aldolase n=1 Tax=Silvimonas terrae TaxID=300266 RepID=A0A840RG12_9NEIS|nr:peptidoglycan-binding domain-containing protein [Silvimonas terrae]MBB5191458.1 fructose/tagatose bisphosphate aldolase [Silvimonas terrae]